MTQERGLESSSGLSKGQIVRSKAGHDKGKVYIVWEIIDGKHVLIVDGDQRKLQKPKKKRVLHLQKFNRMIDLAFEIENDLGVKNARIRKQLEPYQLKEGSECHPKMSSK